MSPLDDSPARCATCGQYRWGDGKLGTPNLENAAAELVARALARVPVHQRDLFLRSMMRHCAAGLVVIYGTEKAAEDVYRLADEVVHKGHAI